MFTPSRQAGRAIAETARPPILGLASFPFCWPHHPVGVSVNGGPGATPAGRPLHFTSRLQALAFHECSVAILAATALHRMRVCFPRRRRSQAPYSYTDAASSTKVLHPEKIFARVRGMKTTFRVENPNNIVMTMTITMPLEQWIGVRSQLSHKWPATDLYYKIGEMVMLAERTFSPTEGPDNP